MGGWLAGVHSDFSAHSPFCSPCVCPVPAECQDGGSDASSRVGGGWAARCGASERPAAHCLLLTTLNARGNGSMLSWDACVRRGSASQVTHRSSHSPARPPTHPSSYVDGLKTCDAFVHLASCAEKRIPSGRSCLNFLVHIYKGPRINGHAYAKNFADVLSIHWI